MAKTPKPPKPKRKNTPWPRCREKDFAKIGEIAKRTLVYVTNIPDDAFTAHGKDKAALLDEITTIALDAAELVAQFSELPDLFPPPGTRAVKARAKFAVGAKVRIRKNRMDEYRGVFLEHVGDEFEICGELRGNLAPIRYPGGETVFAPKAHIFVVSADDKTEDEEE